MAEGNLFGSSVDAKKISLLVVLFIFFAIPVTLVATLNRNTNVSQAALCLDVDGDGVVKSTDVNLLRDEIKNGDASLKNDFNADGLVDNRDLTVLSRSLNSTCAPKIRFFADPATVASGGSTILHWSVDYAQSVTIDGVGAVEKEGNKKATVQQTAIFTLTATGSGGTVKATTKVSVSP